MYKEDAWSMEYQDYWSLLKKKKKKKKTRNVGMTELIYFSVNQGAI
jgi:hypothetical protein